MRFMLSSNVLVGFTLTRLLPLGIVLLLMACQSTTRTSEIERAYRADICKRAWLGVTTSRHDVLTDQTKLEIEQDTAARKAFCSGAL